MRKLKHYWKDIKKDNAEYLSEESFCGKIGFWYYRIKDFLFDEIPCAWQRAYQGFYWGEISDFDSCLTERIITLLKEVKKENCKWTVMINPDTNTDLTEEEQVKVFDDIIWNFENSDPDKIMDELYYSKYPIFAKANDISSNEAPEGFYSECYKKATQISEQREKVAWDLMLKYYHQLWV